MKLPRRNFLHLAAGAAALPAVSRIAWAQAYPSRPVRIIVGFPAGFASDAVARLIAQSLSESLRQQFVVENRPGASSNIAADAVVRATPDGYSLLLVTQTNAINAPFLDLAWRKGSFIWFFSEMPEPLANSPAEFGNYILQYTEKWGKVVRAHQGRINPARRLAFQGRTE